MSDAAGIISRVWWQALDRIVRAVRFHLPVTGQATFAADTTVAVTFSVPEKTTDYNIHIEAVANRTYWITSKATTGFTVNASASNSDTVGWTVVRR